jgi:hypothetical protein
MNNLFIIRRRKEKTNREEDQEYKTGRLIADLSELYYFHSILHNLSSQ